MFSGLDSRSLLSRIIFDTVFTRPLVAFLVPHKETCRMDVLLLSLSIGFFLLSGWLIFALDRL
jgi:hypothetical protein